MELGRGKKKKKRGDVKAENPCPHVPEGIVVQTLSKLPANDHVKKFRKGPLENEELMKKIFQGCTGTGRHVITPGQLEEESMVPMVEGWGDSDEVREVGIGVSAGAAASIPEVQTTHHTRKDSGGTSLGKKKRKASFGAAGFAVSNTYKDLIIQTIREKKYKVEIFNMTSKHYIGVAMEVLESLPGFEDGGPLYFWALDILKSNPFNLDVFMSFKSNETRLDWLKWEHGKQTMAALSGDVPYPPHFPLHSLF